MEYSQIVLRFKQKKHMNLGTSEILLNHKPYNILRVEIREACKRSWNMHGTEI